MEIGVHLPYTDYTVHIERGLIARVGEFLPHGRRLLLVTDSGVPAQYAEAVRAQCENVTVFTFPQGEGSKNMQTYCRILSALHDGGFDRRDAVVALGGGVTGDMAGFAAATYLRGIAFYQSPTTLLSMLDSSVGGKVAVDFGGYKNTVGAFYQPRGVFADPEVLSTLPARQVAGGYAEAIKLFAAVDRDLFARMERGEAELTEIIAAGVQKKAYVVEQDEKESGLRRVLNFGHTVGHAVESAMLETDTPLLHGECVGLGMLCMSRGEARERIRAVLRRYGLPLHATVNRDAFSAALRHDKKTDGDTLHAVTVDEIGAYAFRDMTAAEITARAGEVLELR